jgi:hypothetical protein
MNRRRAAATLSATLLAIGLMGPAGAETETDTETETGTVYEPVLNPERAYFTCEAADRAGNVANQLGDIAWSTTAPSDSEMTGGGCYSFDWTYDATFGFGPDLGGPVRDAASTLTYRGTHTGNLDQLTFRQWAMSFGDPDGRWPVELGVTINGEEVVPFPTKVAATKIADGLKDISAFTVTGIGLLGEDEAGEHEIVISFRYDEPFRATAWQWGVTEAPSGVEFSPSTTTGAVVQARR